MYYKAKPTGLEDTIIFWCRECNHRLAPQPYPLLSAHVEMSRCPECNKYRMSFVTFQRGVEDDRAEGVITAYC